MSLSGHHDDDHDKVNFYVDYWTIGLVHTQGRDYARTCYYKTIVMHDRLLIVEQVLLKKINKARRVS